LRGTRFRRGGDDFGIRGAASSWFLGDWATHSGGNIGGGLDALGAEEAESEWATTVVIAEFGIGDEALDARGHGISLSQDIVVTSEGDGGIGTGCLAIREGA
jgi:hypothetical protein